MLLRTIASQGDCLSGRLPLRTIASQDECFSRRILITIHINEETADKQSMIIHGGSSAVSLYLYGFILIWKRGLLPGYAGSSPRLINLREQ